MRNRSGKKAGQPIKDCGNLTQDAEEAREYKEHLQTMQIVAGVEDVKIDDDELKTKIRFLSIPIPQRSSDLSKLPDKCFADMSFLFTVLAETPSEKGRNYFNQESPSIRRVRRKKGKHGPVSSGEIFVTDIKIDGTKVSNVLIDPSFPHTVMSSNFFYTKFWRRDGNQGLLLKPAAEDKSKKFVNGYKSRGVCTLQLEWDDRRINSRCSVIEDAPFPLLLGRAVNPFFSSQKILEQEFDTQKFYAARSTGLATLFTPQLSFLKSTLQMSTSFKSLNIDRDLEARQMFPVLIAALERWAAEKKRSILQSKLLGTSRDSKEAMHGDHSKGIKALYDFFLHVLRVFYFLPKGRRYRRLHCNCNHDGQQLSAIVRETERSKSRADSRSGACHNRTDSDVLKRKYLRKFVLERIIEDQPHLHSCSNVRCSRKEPTPGHFDVCQECLTEYTLVRHFYCSRACQIEEWKWNHRTYHNLVKRPYVYKFDEEDVKPYPMMVKQNGRYKEVTFNIFHGEEF